MATLDAIVNFGPDNRINGMKYSPGHWVRKAMEFQDEARKVATEWRLRRDSINADPDLTPEGKRKALKKAHDAAEEKLREFETRILARLTDERNRLAAQAANNGKPLTLEDVIRNQDEQEDRRLLYDLDSSQRQAVYEQALKDRNERTLNAFHNAPSFKPLLNPQVLEAGKKMLEKPRDPELVDYETAEAALRENITDVRTGIKKEAGIEEKWRDPRLDESAA